MAKTIVVIDDDRQVLELVNGILQKEYTIKPFSDPKEALTALRKGARPDLIISDVMMPELTGFELHEAVRSIPNLISVPFLYLTALDDKTYFRKGMLQGADDYITKPFLAKDLRKAVSMRLLRTAEIQQVEDENVSTNTMLVIQSLGGFKALYSKEQIKWNVKKAAAAFLYFLHSNKSIPIEQIKKDLWWEPVVDNTVHVLNLRLRKVVSPFANLEVSQGLISLQLTCSYKLDAKEFQTKAQKALEKREFHEIDKALQAYKGEFMPSFDLPWVGEQRAKYENFYLQLLELSVEVAPDGTNERVARERLDRFING